MLLASLDIASRSQDFSGRLLHAKEKRSSLTMIRLEMECLRLWPALCHLIEPPPGGVPASVVDEDSLVGFAKPITDGADLRQKRRDILLLVKEKVLRSRSLASSCENQGSAEALFLSPPVFQRACPSRRSQRTLGYDCVGSFGHIQRGKEIELQKLCLNWLLLHDIYFEYDRPDKTHEWEKRPGRLPDLL
jgi:hypothetical protein